MQRLDVFKKKSGKLPLRSASHSNKGLVLSITHSAAASLPLHSQQNVRFLSTAFDRSGSSFLAADHQGNVFHFDLISGRFKHIMRTGKVPGCMSFSLARASEFLVANSDYTLACYDIVRGELISEMRGHESLINGLCVDKKGSYAISTSLDTAQLWDLEKFQRKKRLNVRQGVGIVKVLFIPHSSLLVTCFKDDSVFIWDKQTLEFVQQLNTSTSSSDEPTHIRPAPAFKTFAISGDGRLLVGGGRSRFVYIWLLGDYSLLKVIELPQTVTCVHQIEFLPTLFYNTAQTLLILTQEGLIRGYSMHTHQQIFVVGGTHDSSRRILSFSLPPPPPANQSLGPASTDTSHSISKGNTTKNLGSYLDSMQNSYGSTGAKNSADYNHTPNDLRAASRAPNNLAPNNLAPRDPARRSPGLSSIASDVPVALQGKGSFDTNGFSESGDDSITAQSLGRHLVTITDHGDIHLYDVNAITESRVNKAPASLLKLSKENKMCSQTLNSTGSMSERSKLTRSMTAGSKVNRSARSMGALLQESKGEESNFTEIPEKLNKTRLLKILRGYGEYPEKYRMFIWKILLRLPENHEAYQALVEKGVHPAFNNLQQRYPIKSRKLMRGLQRVLSQLAHWSPIFGETQYLPMLVFPFVKLFQNNQFVCFELIATLMVVWCGGWFEYFPNPPINILSLVENLLSHHDLTLLQHFSNNNITSQIYSWPVLETLFSEVVTREEWLRLMDHVLTNHPVFLLCVSVAYCIVGRAALLRTTNREDFMYYFHHRNPTSISKLISESYRVLETTPTNLDPRLLLDDFSPLSKGAYPIFNKYPKFIVDFQVQERERIRQEEEQYSRLTAETQQLREEAELRAAAERSWYNEQKQLCEAETARRRVIELEEDRLVQQRTRLNAMRREVGMKELELLEASRVRFIEHSRQQQQQEINKLDLEIKRKVNTRALETQSAVDEVTIRNIELQIKRKMLEQELMRQDTEQQNNRRREIDTWRDTQTGKHSDIHTDNQTDRTKLREDLERGIGHIDLRVNDKEQRTRLNDTILRYKLNNSEQQRTDALISELRRQNKELEEDVLRTTKRLEAAKISGLERNGSKLLAREELDQNSSELGQRLSELGQTSPELGQRSSELGHMSSELGHRSSELGQRSSELDQKSSKLGQRSCVLEDQAPRSFSTTALHVAERLNTGCALEDNDSDDTYTIVSLDRGRQSLDNSESLLLENVRDLRHRLATAQI